MSKKFLFRRHSLNYNKIECIVLSYNYTEIYQQHMVYNMLIIFIETKKKQLQSLIQLKTIYLFKKNSAELITVYSKSIMDLFLHSK